MSTQNISDYLTKQIFIDRNIVTYRSLSRHLAIHVNVAKNELATYHHDAPYKSQTCTATYLLSGNVLSLRRDQYKGVGNDDIDMEEGPSTRQDEEDDDGDDVPQVQVTIVNEADLEAAKVSYDKIHSIHVYSLSPSPIHDAGLVCAQTEYIRNTDKNAAIDMAGKVGRVIGADIKMRNLKKGKQPVVPVAGPSTLKQLPVPETKPSGIDNPKEKSKASGKINFFKAKPKGVKEIKKEEPAKEAKKMFFTKVPSPAPSVASVKVELDPQTENKKEEPAKEAKNMFFTKVPSPAPSVASVKGELDPRTRGTKRKSTVELEPRARTPENPAVTNNVRVTIMNVSTINDDEKEQMDDVDMADGTTSEPKKTRKKREKKTIPVGRNGLKKKRVTKTKKTMDDNGYMRTEDYTDWESVDEEVEPEPPSRAKGKRKAVSLKKEDESTEVLAVLEDNVIEGQQLPQNTPAPAAKKKQSKTSAKTKPQKGLLNFFGPKRD